MKTSLHWKAAALTALLLLCAGGAYALAQMDKTPLRSAEEPSSPPEKVAWRSDSTAHEGERSAFMPSEAAGEASPQRVAYHR